MCLLFLAGGKKFCTTVDTLTQREPYSMLAAMFSGRHTVCHDPEKVIYLFPDTSSVFPSIFLKVLDFPIF